MRNARKRQYSFGQISKPIFGRAKLLLSLCLGSPRLGGSLALPVCVLVSLFVSFVAPNRISAAEIPRPFDGFTAADEAYKRSDAKRRADIAMQLATIEQMKWYAAFDPGGFALRRPSLDYAYGFGRYGAVPGYSFFRSPSYLGVFEPWPFVPGDIWGYPWIESVRQPIGRMEIQTGPRRWESHPIYAPTLGAVQPRPVDLEPEPVAPLRKPSGPREF